jgi:hypothetical protein
MTEEQFEAMGFPIEMQRKAQKEINEEDAVLDDQREE